MTPSMKSESFGSQKLGLDALSYWTLKSNNSDQGEPPPSQPPSSSSTIDNTISEISMPQPQQQQHHLIQHQLNQQNQHYQPHQPQPPGVTGLFAVFLLLVMIMAYRRWGFRHLRCNSCCSSLCCCCPRCCKNNQDDDDDDDDDGGMRHRRRRGRHSDLESGRVNGSWSSSSSSHGFGASRTRTATASVGGRYYQQHQRFHHQRGNGSSFTTPTLILLPHGRMLVVDGTIFAQLQAENNGLDLVELGESVIRNTPSQCSVIEMDAETPSKDSMGSLGCFPPPTYESLYGKDEGADVPPSYSEILLHRFANLLDIEVQEQRGHQSNEARGSGTTSRHHSLSQHHRTSNSLNRNRLGDKDEPELRSLQNCPGSSDSGPHLVGNPLSILRASCHSLPPVHQLAHHYQIDPPSPGEQEGYTRVQVEQNRFQTMAPKPMQPRSRKASSADPSEVPEALQIGWDIQQRQHQAMRQESLEMGESGRGVEDESEDDVAGAGAAAGPQFFGSDVSLDDRYLHWDHSRRSEDSSTNLRGSTRDDRYRDEFHYSDPRQSQSYRISPRPNRRSIESELVRIHHENRLAAAEQIDWQLGDLDVRYSSEDDEKRENCPSEDDNLEDDSRNFQVLTDIRESRV